MIARLVLGAALLAFATGAAPVTTAGDDALELRFTNLRSAKGNLLICITADPAFFPDCSNDPDKRFLTVSARRPSLTVKGLTQPRYAVSAHHDENANDRLDTFAGIPKEGIGFSRNPRVTFGPPGFDRVALTIASAPHAQTVRMQYFL